MESFIQTSGVKPNAYGGNTGGPSVTISSKRPGSTVTVDLFNLP